MPEKDPHNLSVFHTVLSLVLFGIGGVLRHAQKLIEGKPFNIGEFIFEVISSLFVGSVFYLILRGVGVAELTSVWGLKLKHHPCSK
ncbi:hypothetical protein [uncultured Parasutterella sp.]|uniref:hypothetical protein n=1 Tax=uncultured Parasutterella sp. TaxID=1263098 RepID=UPI0025941871|nr:hypothetical protein [uncultured Parasutterella sp.]